MSEKNKDLTPKTFEKYYSKIVKLHSVDFMCTGKEIFMPTGNGSGLKKAADTNTLFHLKRWELIRANFASHLEKKVPESGGRIERHTIQDPWSSVWSFHSLCWFRGTMKSVAVDPLCLCLPGNFREHHGSFKRQALWRRWLHIPAGLGTSPHCQKY